MSECNECHGSINNANGVCIDCGADVLCDAYDDWSDSIPPVDAYEEAA